jgi:GntR family transcriptional regulator
MNITISNASPEPLYEQIASQIKNSIMRGELASGEMLPSIRHLARELQISVITTKRSYEELEREGFIDSVAGKGSFVAAQSNGLLRERRLKFIEEKLVEIVEESRTLEIGLPELIEMMTMLYREE